MQLADACLIQVRVHHRLDFDLELRPQASRWLLDHEVAALYSHALCLRFRSRRRPH